MKRNYFEPPNPIIPQELINRSAFHEAGHAAAIYLYNRQKQLPPVYFSIKFKKPEPAAANGAAARVDGGRLIQSLSPSAGDFRDCACSSGENVKNAYFAAFEADIVNLLSGPIAEAKYVALTDGEEFNARLLNLSALNHYGGASDLKIINGYMNSRFDCKAKKNAKIAELFKLAFEFVEQAPTWRAVTALAHYIRDSGKQLIECEEAIAVIDGACRLGHKLDKRLEHSIARQ
jgi:hypothetical protein